MFGGVRVRLGERKREGVNLVKTEDGSVCVCVLPLGPGLDLDLRYCVMRLLLQNLKE